MICKGWDVCFVRECVRACVRACLCVCVSVHLSLFGCLSVPVLVYGIYVEAMGLEYRCEMMSKPAATYRCMATGTLPCFNV